MTGHKVQIYGVHTRRKYHNIYRSQQLGMHEKNKSRRDVLLTQKRFPSIRLDAGTERWWCNRFMQPNHYVLSIHYRWSVLFKIFFGRAKLTEGCTQRCDDRSADPRGIPVVIRLAHVHFQFVMLLQTLHTLLQSVGWGAGLRSGWLRLNQGLELTPN